MNAARITYRFPRGAPVRLGLQETTGDSSALTERRAVLKKAGPGMTMPPATGPAAATFTITARAAVTLPVPVAKGFDLVLSDDVARALPAGVYVVTPAFGANGDVWEIAAPLFIAIDEVTTDSVTP